MTIDQKERFRRILQALSNGKLEMGRMDLQKALEYFHMAHARAHEYADFIKLNDIDKEICAKCMSGDRITIDPEAPALEDYKRALHATRGVLYEVLRILHTIVKRNQGGYAEDKTDINRAIELIVHTPGRGLDSSPTPEPMPAGTLPQSTGRDFSWALLHMKAGNGVKRGAWTPGYGTGGRAPHVRLRFLTGNGSRPTPVELRMTVPGSTQQMDKHILWKPAFDDLIADDWELA